MDDRSEMIEFAIKRMAGYTMKGSSYGDNRSIFSLVRTIINTSKGVSLVECREPISAVLKINNSNKRFMGCKLPLLKQTIIALFGEPNKLLSDNGFKGYNREMLLTYLEISRKIFVTQYAPSTPKANEREKRVEQRVEETEMERAFRLARER